MLKIKRFKLKPNADIFTFPWGRIIGIIRTPVTYVNKDSICGFWDYLVGDDISITIAFPEDFSKWNDFDYVLVLDEAFGQPYGPFYHYMGGKIELFPYLENVIEKYNEFMSSMPFLEEINENLSSVC